jgi:hypothetical protein
MTLPYLAIAVLILAAGAVLVPLAASLDPDHG